MHNVRLWWPILANVMVITTISAGILSSWTIVRASLLGLACAGVIVVAVLSTVEIVITDRRDWRRANHAMLTAQNAWLMEAYLSALDWNITTEDYWTRETGRLQGLLQEARTPAKTTIPDLSRSAHHAHQ